LSRRAIFLILLLFIPSVVFAAQRYNVPIDDSPQKGPKNAPVTIIEFLDFQ